MAVDEQKLIKRPYGFQPGQSGNPTGGGIYRHPNLLKTLKNKLNAQAERKRKKGEQVSQCLVRDQIVEELLRLALKAKDDRVRFVAIKEIFDRTEGKPMQTVSITESPDDFRAKVMIFLEECRRAGLATSEEEAARLLSEPIETTAVEVQGDE